MGALVEKYNVEQSGVLAGGGEYEVQDGFVWTIAVLLRLMDELGDVVEITSEGLGTLRNIVRLSTECAVWNFGSSHLICNLAQRNLMQGC